MAKVLFSLIIGGILFSGCDIDYDENSTRSCPKDDFNSVCGDKDYYFQEMAIIKWFDGSITTNELRASFVGETWATVQLKDRRRIHLPTRCLVNYEEKRMK